LNWIIAKLTVSFPKTLLPSHADPSIAGVELSMPVVGLVDLNSFYIDWRVTTSISGKILKILPRCTEIDLITAI
jgi:hypothetical protein